MNIFKIICKVSPNSIKSVDKSINRQDYNLLCTSSETEKDTLEQQYLLEKRLGHLARINWDLEITNQGPIRPVPISCSQYMQNLCCVLLKIVKKGLELLSDPPWKSCPHISTAVPLPGFDDPAIFNQRLSFVPHCFQQAPAIPRSRSQAQGDGLPTSHKQSARTGRTGLLASRVSEGQCKSCPGSSVRNCLYFPHRIYLWKPLCKHVLLAGFTESLKNFKTLQCMQSTTETTVSLKGTVFSVSHSGVSHRNVEAATHRKDPDAPTFLYAE